MEIQGPSLPSNYVTILQLKERWLQQQNPANSNDEHHSHSNSKPNEQAAFKCTTSRNQNRHRDIHQLKPEITVLDSASKTVVDVANNHPEEEKEEHNNDHSNNKQSKKKKSRRSRVFSNPLEPEQVEEKEQPQYTGGRARKPRFFADRNPVGGITPSLEPEPVSEPVKDKEQPRSTGGRARKPRFVTDQNPAGDITPPLKPEPIPESEEEKEHRRHTGGRRSWNQKVVREPKHKTTPFVQNSEALLHNAACGDGVVEDVAVKEINVTNRRWISGKFHENPKPWPSKPPFGVKKVQIWVKKGESAPN